MRIGVFGGTLNPIHYGHLNSASEVAQILDLEKVIFIPTNINPHKEAIVKNPYYRLEMTRMAIAGNPKFTVSPLEIERGGTSYTIDTINDLYNLFGADDDFFLILGVDAFMEIDKWKDSALIFRRCNIVVNLREKENPDEIKDVLLRCKEVEFGPREKNDVKNIDKIAVRNTKFSVFLIKTTLVDISSTKIRERVVKGETIKYLLPEKVEEFILKNKIYTND